MKKIIITAFDNNQGIGYKGNIPWNFSEELKFFKEITYGSPIIMGRKTFESIGKPLPGRTNIVVSKTLKNNNVLIVKSLQDAFETAEKYQGEYGWCFVIGGSELYKEALNYVDELMISKIQGSFKCDTFFPKIDTNWRMNEILAETYLQDKLTDKFFNVKIEIFKKY